MAHDPDAPRGPEEVTDRPAEVGRAAEGPFLDELFAEISTLPPTRWDAAIEERCGDDAALKAELTDLLRAQAQDRARLDRLQGGERVAGRYRLRRHLGRGSSATVWEADDLLLDREVALKLLRPRRDAQRRKVGHVLQEARATSRVVSDHVIRVYDAGRDDELDLAYIVMEVCAAYESETDRRILGRTLSARLADRQVSRESAIRLIIGACHGVQAAHDQGVFHRDIKPDNVLVRPESKERAQVTDFGLAIRDLDEAGSDLVDAERTITIQRGVANRIAGTPAFMAPEQAAGLPPLDPDTSESDRRKLRRIDVFGLGATLYTALTGHPPYRADPDAPDPLADVLAQAVRGNPASLRDRESRFRVPRRLARIVARALHRNPESRYQTAAALARDLERYLARRPTDEDRRRPLLRTALAVRRNWATVVGALALTIAVGAFVATAVRVTSMKRSNAQLSDAAAKLKQRRAALRREVQAQKIILARTTQRLNDTARDLLAKEKQWEVAERKGAIARDELAKTSDALGKMRLATRRCVYREFREKQINEQLRDERDRRQEELSELQTQNQFLTDESDRWRRRAKERAKQLRQRARQLDDLKARLTAEVARVAKLQRDAEVQRAGAQELAATLARSRAEVERLGAAREALSRKIAALRAKLARTMSPTPARPVSGAAGSSSSTGGAAAPSTAARH